MGDNPTVLDTTTMASTKERFVANTAEHDGLLGRLRTVAHDFSVALDSDGAGTALQAIFNDVQAAGKQLGDRADRMALDMGVNQREIEQADADVRSILNGIDTI